MQLFLWFPLNTSLTVLSSSTHCSNYKIGSKTFKTNTINTFYSFASEMKYGTGPVPQLTAANIYKELPLFFGISHLVA